MNMQSQYGVVVGALQETKWFGVGVYEVAGSTVLSSGRSLPSHGSVFQHDEGVALVLSGLVAEAWKCGGSLVDNGVVGVLIVCLLNWCLVTGLTVKSM